MAAPNIVNVTTITGKTAGLAVTTSATDIVDNPASSGKVFKVNSLIISNVDGQILLILQLMFIKTKHLLLN